MVKLEREREDVEEDEEDMEVEKNEKEDEEEDEKDQHMSDEHLRLAPPREDVGEDEASACGPRRYT